ncbi:MAG: ferric reductase-like transmembrane domain-containing protein [Pelovirga sp.]
MINKTEPGLKRDITGFFWITIFLTIVIFPVCIMLVPPTPSGREFWLEFSIALGFFGLIQLFIQFILIARIKSVTRPYGIDVILQLHRRLAIVAISVMLFHPIIIMVNNPSRLKLLHPLEGNWASRFAIISVLFLLILASTSLFREKIKLNYEYWRISHLVLSVLVIVFSQLHVSLAGLYTNTIWKQALLVTMATAMLGLVFYLRIIKPAWQRGNSWRVTEVRQERGDSWTLALEAENHAGVSFLPGQFAWLKLANSPFTLEEHPFSFSSGSMSTTCVEFGIKELGDFTRGIKNIHPGARAFLDGPYGAFSIDRYPAVGFIFVAGGIGIAPIMSFLRSMAERKDPRPVVLVYADQTWDGLTFREDIENLKEKLDLNVVHVLEKPHENWQGERGMIDKELLRSYLPKDSIHRSIFICGPEPMMQAVQTLLLEFGVEKANIHLERFSMA